MSDLIEQVTELRDLADTEGEWLILDSILKRIAELEANLEHEIESHKMTLNRESLQQKHIIELEGDAAAEQKARNFHADTSALEKAK